MDDTERITRIEERLERFSEQTRLEMQAVEVRLTRIESQMATKTDLEQAIDSVVKWVVGTIFGAAVVSVTVMTFVLNNAVPKPVAAPVQPIVIQLPAQALPRP